MGGHDVEKSEQTPKLVVQMPLIRRMDFDKQMQSFMYSFKNIYSPNINASNLALIFGPTKSGKSWFLRNNIKKFSQNETKPLIFYFDLKKAEILDFNTFLHEFELSIIKTLVNANKRKDQMNEESSKVFNPDYMLKKVALRFYDPFLFEQDLAKMLNKASKESAVFGLPFETEKEKKKIQEFVDLYRQKEYKERPLLDKWTELVD